MLVDWQVIEYVVFSEERHEGEVTNGEVGE